MFLLTDCVIKIKFLAVLTFPLKKGLAPILVVATAFIPYLLLFSHKHSIVAALCLYFGCLLG